MVLIELFAPGVLDTAQQERLARRMIEVLVTSDHPEGSHSSDVIDSAMASTQVLIHKPATWTVGGQQPVDPADPLRYLVRVGAPAVWRMDMSAHAIDHLTQALAETESAAGRDPDRLRREAHAWIHVTGITEGNLGTRGRPMGSLDLLQHLTTPHRTATPSPGCPP